MVSGNRAREEKVAVWTVTIGIDAGEAVIAEELVAERRVGVSAGSHEIVYGSTANELFFDCDAIPGNVAIEVPGVRNCPFGCNVVMATDDNALGDDRM